MKENTEPEKERERKYRQKRYNGKGLKRGDKCRVTKGHWQGLRTTHFRKWFIFYYLQPRVRCALDRFSLLSWENRERRTGEVSVGKRSNIYNRRQQSKKLGKNERSRVKGGGRRRREIKGEIERRKGGSFLFCVSHNGDGFCRTEGREGGSVSERRDGISVSERMEDCSRAFCHDFKRRLWAARMAGHAGEKPLEWKVWKVGPVGPRERLFIRFSIRVKWPILPSFAEVITGQKCKWDEQRGKKWGSY